MSDTFSLPALVIVDVQKAIDDPGWGPRNNPGAETTMCELLTLWRKKELPIFHIRHDSTESDSAYRPGQPGNEFKPEVQPLPSETVIPKQTNSAFIGTDLSQQLVASGCDVVVYMGVITNNSLEATVRMSGNLGFSSFVVSDASWTVDKTDSSGRRWNAEDVHALALANMNGEYATVVDANEVAALVRQIET